MSAAEYLHEAVLAEIGTLQSQGGLLLYLDEIQYLNKKQQQSLLECIEEGTVTLIASTTENPYFYIYSALLSRCAVFEFKALAAADAAHRQAAEEDVPAVGAGVGLALVHQPEAQAQAAQPAQRGRGIVECELGVQFGEAVMRLLGCLGGG